MPYIGKEPAVGNFVKLDAISTSSTNSYSLTLDSVAFVPESANHMLVSLNGVIQAPLTSFSVSGSTITFLPSSGTLSSSDSIDFIMVYGNVLDIGTPSDSTVTNAKTNFVSTSSAAGLQIKGDGTTDGTLQLNCSQNSHGIKLKSPAHSTSSSYTLTFPGTDPSADKFIKTDGSGNLSFADVDSGTHVKLVETNVSSATSDITVNNLFTTDYDNYLLYITDFLCSTPQHAYIRVLVSGSEVSASNYYNVEHTASGSSGSASSSASRNWGGSNWFLSHWYPASNSNDMSFFKIDIFNPLNTASNPTFKVNGAVNGDNFNQLVVTNSMLQYNVATAISGFKIYMSSGNITNANLILYGVKN